MAVSVVWLWSKRRKQSSYFSFARFAEKKAECETNFHLITYCRVHALKQNFWVRLVFLKGQHIQNWQTWKTSNFNVPSTFTFSILKLSEIWNTPNKNVSVKHILCYFINVDQLTVELEIYDCSIVWMYEIIHLCNFTNCATFGILLGTPVKTKLIKTTQMMFSHCIFPISVYWMKRNTIKCGLLNDV